MYDSNRLDTVLYLFTGSLMLSVVRHGIFVDTLPLEPSTTNAYELKHVVLPDVRAEINDVGEQTTLNSTEQQSGKNASTTNSSTEKLTQFSRSLDKDHGKKSSKTELREKLFTIRPSNRPSYIDMTTRENQIRYLLQFDYIDMCEVAQMCEETTINWANFTNIISLVNDSMFTEGIRRFQSIWGIEVTGLAGFRTRKLMGHPRCGNPDTDIINKKFPNLPNRVKRFVVTNPWATSKRGALKYVFADERGVDCTGCNVYPNHGPASGISQQSAVKDWINKAVQRWYIYTSSLMISELTTFGVKPDFYIKFGGFSHGDNYPFDGPSGVLAHGFYPQVGNLHFDDSESWTFAYGAKEINLLNVAIHEFGHGVGMLHSELNSKPKPIMFPFYDGTRVDPQLTPDDLQGIQKLYGTAVTTTQHPGYVYTFPPLVPANFCTSPGVDGSYSDKSGDIYFIRGKMIVKVDAKGIVPGYPKFVAQIYTDIPVDANIDACLFLPYLYRQRVCSDTRNCYIVEDPGGLYFFIGTRYYMYGVGNVLAELDYISQRFGGVPSLNGAAFMRMDSFIYITYGALIYKLSRTYRVNRVYQLEPGFPKQVSAVFTDLTGTIVTAGMMVTNFAATSAVLVNFVFGGTSYKRYSMVNPTADVVTPPYPRSINSWWFACNDSESATHPKVFELSSLSTGKMPDLVLDLTGNLILAMEDIASVAVVLLAPTLHVNVRLLYLCSCFGVLLWWSH